MEKTHTVYTVGHSNHDIEYYLELLQSQANNCLIDVRSTPASYYNPQFNQVPLHAFLKNHKISYLHFGEEFGARQEDSDLWDNEGIVNFDFFRKTRAFQNGIERLETGLEKGFTIALMCSEGNPLECHRFSMISGYLEEIGIRVIHILKDKSTKTHAELEAVLLKKYQKKLPQPSLFQPNVSEADRVNAVYQLHNKEVGWKSDRFPN